MLTVEARAKVNLSLRIVGKRPDGYHTLHSQVTFPQVADVLTFERAETLQLTVLGEFADQTGDPEKNLVMRAARALNEHVGAQYGAHITITKHIPVGAGLGGGSADAAATLKALNDLWGLAVDFGTLLQLGERLGADVPMCLHSVPLTAAGAGELITPTEQPAHPEWMVLVHPRVALSTAAVFAAYRSAQAKDIARDEALPAGNDLQAAAISLCPVIGDVLDALRAHGAGAKRILMTGSGTCCFALFFSEAEAIACRARMQDHHPQWWIKYAETMI